MTTDAGGCVVTGDPQPGLPLSAAPGAGQRYALSQSDFERLAGFIEASVGIKMPPHKKSMLELRLAKRVRALGMSSFEEYCEFVFEPGGGADEVVRLIDHVTTNKTDFFRESEHFGLLIAAAVPQVQARYPDAGRRRVLRVWSAGCSSGEEPYSIAMVLQRRSEAIERLDFEVIATDLSTAMLSTAVRAVYPEERLHGVPEDMRHRYFLRSKDPSRALARVSPEIRARVRFAWLNLLEPYPFDQTFDIVFCRNTLIYFEREVQVGVLSRISELIVPGGYLFVGHSEALHGMGLPLEHVAPTVYRKVG